MDGMTVRCLDIYVFPIIMHWNCRTLPESKNRQYFSID